MPKPAVRASDACTASGDLTSPRLNVLYGTSSPVPLYPGGSGAPHVPAGTGPSAGRGGAAAGAALSAGAKEGAPAAAGALLAALWPATPRAAKFNTCSSNTAQACASATGLALCYTGGCKVAQSNGRIQLAHFSIVPAVVWSVSNSRVAVPAHIEDVAPHASHPVEYRHP